MPFLDLILGRRRSAQPDHAPIGDSELLTRLDALAAKALASGRVDRDEAQRLARASRSRWTEAEFTEAVRQAARRQIALRDAGRRATPVDPLTARAEAGYRESRSFNR